MGYTTEFEGQIDIEPPLNRAEVEYINKFADTRHMQRANGPYYVDARRGWGDESDVTDPNTPPEDQPGLWCNWEASGDGTAIFWNGMEKFYDSAEWMQYLIDHFLKEGAEVQKELLRRERAKLEGPSVFEAFTFNHILNGVIEAQGEDPEDKWRLWVKNNEVIVQKARVVWEPLP